jgi:hypothetical protein
VRKKFAAANPNPDPERFYDENVKNVTGEKDDRAPAQPPALRELVMNF